MQLCSCEKKAWKKFRHVRDSNPWPLQPAPSWHVSSIDRALHQYHRGQGFESCTSLNFFQAFFLQPQSCVYNCDDLDCEQSLFRSKICKREYWSSEVVLVLRAQIRAKRETAMVSYGILDARWQLDSSCHKRPFCKIILNNVQGCALAEPDGPWPLTFALRRLENLRFFIQIICWAP